MSDDKRTSESSGEPIEKTAGAGTPHEKGNFTVTFGKDMSPEGIAKTLNELIKEHIDPEWNAD